MDWMNLMYKAGDKFLTQAGYIYSVLQKTETGVKAQDRFGVVLDFPTEFLDKQTEEYPQVMVKSKTTLRSAIMSETIRDTDGNQLSLTFRNDGNGDYVEINGKLNIENSKDSSALKREIDKLLKQTAK